MSENPNPTVCGTCGAENPPGREVCLRCRAPLTLAAGAAALAETPEAPDELRRLEAGGAEGTARGGADTVVMGGPGGAPIPVPPETLDLDPDRPPHR